MRFSLQRFSLAALLLPLTLSLAHAQGTLVPEPDMRSLQSSAMVECDSTNPMLGWNLTLGPFDCNGPVFEIVNAPNSRREVYVAGNFTMIGGIAANYIARWDGENWHALGDGLSGPAFALAFHGDTLYVGGRFQQAGGVLAKNIARWNGTAWTPLGADFVNGLDSAVLALVCIGDTLYAGGNFTYSDDAQLLNRIACWSVPENAWSALDDGTNVGVDGGVAALAVVQDTLYVGGSFTKAGSSNAARIARWNGDSWSNLISGVGPAGSFVATMVANDSNLYVGGDFTLAGGKPAQHIARWNTASRSWNSLGLGAKNGVDAPVNKLYFSTRGGVDVQVGLHVAGEFRLAGGDSANGVAVWTDGSGWNNPYNCGLDGAGFSLAVVEFKDYGWGLWVGGGFTKAGGRLSPNLAIYEDHFSMSVDRRAENSMLSVATRSGANGVVELHLTLGESARSRNLAVDLVDMEGRAVRQLFEGISPSAQILLPVPPDVVSGRYLCRVRTADGLISQPVVVVR